MVNIDYVIEYLDIVQTTDDHYQIVMYWIYFISYQVFSYGYTRLVHGMSDRNDWKQIVKYKFLLEFSGDLYSFLFFMTFQNKIFTIQFVALLVSVTLISLLTQTPIKQWIINKCINCAKRYLHVCLCCKCCCHDHDHDHEQMTENKLDTSVVRQFEFELHVSVGIVTIVGLISHVYLMYFYRNLYQWLNIRVIIIRLSIVVLAKICLYILVQKYMFTSNWKRSTWLLMNKSYFFIFSAAIMYSLYFATVQVITYSFVYQGIWVSKVKQ